MSAGSALNLIGTAIGYYVGGPIGGAIGGMIGGTIGRSIDGNEGPQLQDLKIQASEYGRPIPIVYSTMALGGNVIWASDLVESGSAGGKGTGDPTSQGPTYTANFAVVIAESDGNLGLGRIWAGPDKRLVYDPAGEKMESGSLTFYDGAGNQMPDPLMESYLGAGNVPAYRGFAYIVIQGFDVSSHDGNRIPFLTIEVGRKDTATPGSDAPENLGIVFFDDIIDGGDTIIAPYHGSFFGVIQRSKADMAMVHHRRLNGWTAGQYLFYDQARDTVVRMEHGSSTGSYDTLVMSTGVLTAHPGLLAPDVGPGSPVKGGCMAGGAYVFALNLTGGGGIRFHTVDPAANTLSSTQTFDVGGSKLKYLYGAGAADAWVWGVTEDGYVRRFDLNGSSTASVIVGVAPAGFTGGNTARYDPNNHYLWMATRDSDGAIHYAVVSQTGPVNSGSTTSIGNVVGWIFVPNDPVYGQVAYILGERWLATDHYLKFDSTGAPLVEEDGAYVGISRLLAGMYNDATGVIVGLRDGGSYAVSLTSDPATLPLSSGYMGGLDVAGGSSTLQPQMLDEVVSDLCQRAGLTADQIDVTQLAGIQVDGYILANQVSVRDALATLMPVYYFDGAEDQGKLRFVLRGGAISEQIDDADLGAHASGTEYLQLYETTRRSDEELPGTLSVRYVLAATKYSPAAKYSRRLIGYSADESTMELPLVLTDLKAQQVADVNLHDAWVGRMGYAFQVGRKFSHLMPTDVVGIQGHTMRITQITQVADGFFKCQAVRDDSHTYQPHVIVTETPPPDESIGVRSLTLLELM